MDMGFYRSPFNPLHKASCHRALAMASYDTVFGSGFIIIAQLLRERKQPLGDESFGSYVGIWVPDQVKS